MLNFYNPQKLQANFHKTLKKLLQEKGLPSKHQQTQQSKGYRMSSAIGSAKPTPNIVRDTPKVQAPQKKSPRL